MKKLLISLGILVGTVTGAEAHVEGALTQGFLHGFMHPMGGMDHVLAMVAVGLFAVILGGRALWAVPSSFVAMMVAGGAMGIAGVDVSFVEVGIAMSVLVLGVLVDMQTKLPVAIAAAMVGGLAVFHGVAHGAEMPVDTSGFSYGLGFVCATALLHGVGLGLGLLVSRLGTITISRVAQVGGSLIAAAGLGLVTGWL